MTIANISLVVGVLLFLWTRVSIARDGWLARTLDGAMIVSGLSGCIIMTIGVRALVQTFGPIGFIYAMVVGCVIGVWFLREPKIQYGRSIGPYVMRLPMREVKHQQRKKNEYIMANSGFCVGMGLGVIVAGLLLR